MLDIPIIIGLTIFGLWLVVQMFLLLTEFALITALKRRIWPEGQMPPDYWSRQEDFRAWMSARFTKAGDRLGVANQRMDRALAHQADRNLTAWQRHCPTLARTRLVRWMIGASR